MSKSKVVGPYDLEMTIVHPHKDETYRYIMDDNCIVVSSGRHLYADKVWLSKSMIEWLHKEGRKLIK